MLDLERILSLFGRFCNESCEDPWRITGLDLSPISEESAR